MKCCIALLALLAPLTAGAASFDCARASAADEKAICGHLALNDKDVEMTTKYQFLKGLFAMGARGALQDSQQAWLKSRRQCAGSVSCLNKAYDKRLRELDTVYAGINKPL